MRAMIVFGGLRPVMVFAVTAMLALIGIPARADAAPPLVTWPDLPVMVDSHYTIEPAAFAFYPSGGATVLATRVGAAPSEVVAIDRSADGQWSAPAVLGSGGALDPAIQVTGDGTAVAAWQTGSPGDIVVSSRAADGSWSTPQAVSELGASAAEPSLALTATGTIMLAYTKELVACAGDRCSTYGNDVGVVERPAGGSWGTTRWLTHDQGFIHDVGLRVLPDGSVAVGLAWSNSYVYSNPYLEGAGIIRRPAGSDWQPLEFVYQVTNSALFFSVGGWAVADDGTVAAAYSGQNGGPFVVTRGPDGVVSPTVNLASDAAPDGYAPVVSWSVGGELSVLWNGRLPDNSHQQLYEARRSPAGTWSPPRGLGMTGSSGRLGLTRAGDDALTVWSVESDGSVWTSTRASDAWQPPQLAAKPGQGWTAYGAATSPTGDVMLVYTDGQATWLQTGTRTTVPASVPSEPQDVSATAHDRQVSVTWKPPAANGGAWIAGYTAVAAPGGRSCSTATYLDTTAATACTITGLTNGVTYQISVRAQNAAGLSDPALSGPVVLLTAPGAPRAPIASPRSRALVAAWAGPLSNGGLAISRYVATASPGGRSCATAGARTCTITGLVNGMSYRVTVRAVNARGLGVASTSSAAVCVGAPTAPRAVAIGRPSSSRTTVAWSPPAYLNAGSVRSYQVRWSSNGTAWTAWTSTATRRALSRTGLLRGRTYWVQVRAVNVSGAGLVAMLRFVR